MINISIVQLSNMKLLISPIVTVISCKQSNLNLTLMSIIDINLYKDMIDINLYKDMINI